MRWVRSPLLGRLWTPLDLATARSFKTLLFMLPLRKNTPTTVLAHDVSCMHMCTRGRRPIFFFLLSSLLLLHHVCFSTGHEHWPLKLGPPYFLVCHLFVLILVAGRPSCPVYLSNNIQQVIHFDQVFKRPAGSKESQGGRREAAMRRGRTKGIFNSSDELLVAFWLVGFCETWCASPLENAHPPMPLTHMQ